MYGPRPCCAAPWQNLTEPLRGRSGLGTSLLTWSVCWKLSTTNSWWLLMALIDRFHHCYRQVVGDCALKFRVCDDYLEFSLPFESFYRQLFKWSRLPKHTVANEHAKSQVLAGEFGSSWRKWFQNRAEFFPKAICNLSGKPLTEELLTPLDDERFWNYLTAGIRQTQLSLFWNI